ncbi:MAG: hypothetical protein K0R14_1214 [Burkholderiales bacterium]|jgi:ribosomal protein S12 methylthiotransferase accessory factor|nr:hypothetical protein [Burkholderiales bacterium]
MNSSIDSIRTTTQEETLQLLKPICAKIGITRVANITYLDHFYGIFVSNCIRPNSQNLSISQGKGSSIEAATISAIMESIEGYHIENPPAYKFNGTFNACSIKENCVNPNLFPQTQFKANLTEISFNWSEAYNIFDKSPVFLPTAITQINTCKPNFNYLYFDISTNGLAAGNSIEEAIFHAICEIIERDSLAKWQKSNIHYINQCLIKTDTIDDFNQQYIQKLQEKGLGIRVWNITSNLEVPSYQVALLDNNSLRGLNSFTGSGTHLSKSIALFRAITEAVQARVAYIAGVRDDIFADYYKKMRINDDKFVPKVLLSEGSDYSSSSSLSVGNVESNLSSTLEILLNKQYKQIFVIDHTKPELNIPVVQVFIPGMLLNNSRM